MKEEIYLKTILEALENDASNIELVSNTNNIVYKANTLKYGTVYIKFYLNQSSHIDNEMNLYNILDKAYLKEVIFSSKKPRFAVFKEVKGKTLDELTDSELESLKEKIIDSVKCFYDTLSNVKIEGYGLLDENLKGSSTNFKEFIIDRQMRTQELLKEYPVFCDVFSRIWKKYEDIITGDNSLVPIDTNAKNIMITDKKEIKFIDPGELISAPKLMGYGDFVAHIYKTPLYDCLINKLNLSVDDEKRLRIYAIFSSLNILAFLQDLGVKELEKVIPYGNKYTFDELIKDHLKTLF